jgi:predicted 2-oxoglutarate/Fe(II)-dependent dioxygenase YbiX
MTDCRSGGSKGDRFAPHVDEAFRPAAMKRTFLTLLLYLPTGEPCLGGETVVDGEVVSVTPGRTVLFDHRLVHEGRPVEDGVKIVLRNDIVGCAG